MPAFVGANAANNTFFLKIFDLPCNVSSIYTYNICHFLGGYFIIVLNEFDNFL